MYLGYQNGKIKFYTEEILNPNLYQLERTDFTNDEYVYDADVEEFVLKDETWERKQAQKEAERIAVLKLTKREVFLALYNDLGITPEEVKSSISDPVALIEFEYANEYYRSNPLVNKIGHSLGYSEADLDYLFMHKCLPEPEKKEVDINNA